MGLPEIGPPLGPVGSFLGAPIRLRGARAGNLYLSDKEGGGEFTQDDEETLAMFASHAAMAIANARRHREEQRARAYLETLIDTSPVGVVVFNAGTGVPVSLNREGRRLVDGLTDPGQTAEQLLDVLTFRRADGREISLREFPLAEALSTGETVRAEEIVIGVPDGRSVSVLLNATAIRSEEGQVESVVVTLQDMTALEELDRLRAEFLGMVSHELRAPLTSIKGSAATVLGSSADLDPAVVRQFFRIIEDQADHMHDLVADLLDVARIETGTLPVTPEPAEVAVLVDRARSTFTSAGGRNNLAIDIPPDLPLVMADRRRIVQVVGNLLSNAAKHSSESSVITVTVVREDVHVAVSVADEGRGIPSERLPYLFRKFTRSDGDDLGSGVTGSGLGLAICKGIVEALDLTIEAAFHILGPGFNSENVMDPTWQKRWIEGAANVAADDEERRTWWSRLLAGEIQNPGSYSIRTLSIMDTLSPTEAHLFRKMCSCVWRDASERPVLIMPNASKGETWGMTFRQAKTLEETGLVSIPSLGYHVQLTKGQSQSIPERRLGPIY